MSAWSDAPALRAFLARATRRLAWLSAAESAGAGLCIAVAVVMLIPGALFTAWLAAVFLAAVARGLASRRSPRHIAWLVEQRAPQCANLVVTAAEVMDHPVRVRPYVGERVCGDASRVVSSLDLATLFPAARAAAMFSTGALLWAGTVAFARTGHSSGPPGVAIESVAIRGIDVVVTPPSYTGRAAQTVHDPSRIEALAGSRIHISVRAHAAGITVETTSGRRTLTGVADQFDGDVLADADGYLAIEAASSDGRAGARSLVGLSVTPDLPPRVRLTAPAHDLFLPNGNRTLDLAVEADDDIGLSSLSLRFTRVSGAGEQFTFADGEVPLTLTRTDGRHWRARGTWPLSPLKLAGGDLVVYRGVAADARPGATPVESDTYIVEISGPGSIASEGFAVDDQFDRYALSQQMIILKTERLTARRSSMSDDTLTAETLALAAEQRAVRAEFVFMMGGELSDDASLSGLMTLNEEDEAKAEDDLAAGRLANQGRAALLLAIRAMTAASTSLTTKELDKALKSERSALTFLQGAFARTRYILRALTQRERLDLSRRMTGELAMAARSTQPVVEAAPVPRVVALRRVLANVATLAGARELPSNASVDASNLAQAVLRVDPADSVLQRVATRLTDAAATIARGRSVDARGALDAAATALSAAIRADMPLAPRAARTIETGRLDGARTDALRARAEPPR